MTYHTDNRIRKYVQGYGLLPFAKTFGSKYGKKMINKGANVSKRIKTAAKKFNQSKYGKILKKEGPKVGKLAGKQLSGKIIPVVVDVAASKIPDKITSLKMSDQEPQEELEDNYSTTLKTKDN